MIYKSRILIDNIKYKQTLKTNAKGKLKKKKKKKERKEEKKTCLHFSCVKYQSSAGLPGQQLKNQEYHETNKFSNVFYGSV